MSIVCGQVKRSLGHIGIKYNCGQSRLREREREMATHECGQTGPQSEYFSWLPAILDPAETRLITNNTHTHICSRHEGSFYRIERLFFMLLWNCYAHNEQKTMRQFSIACYRGEIRRGARYERQETGLKSQTAARVRSLLVLTPHATHVCA